eukprot:jgi/Orpsp1_1/1186505/evm.model.d7180000051075.1
MIRFIHKQILILFILIYKYVLSIDVYIPNDNYDLSNLSDLISYYSIKYKTINIYINDEYYTSNSKQRYNQINIPENTNVALIGNPKNGTIIDLTNNSFYYSIVFNEYTGQEFKVENITFYNFFDPLSVTANDIFYINPTSTNYKIIFKNCIFDTSNSLIFQLNINTDSYQENKDYQLTFDSCQFINIKGNGVIYLSKIYYDIINNTRVKIINSKFINCYNIMKSEYGEIIFDKCSFSKLFSLSEYASFIDMIFNQTVSINNSIFYDIDDVYTPMPLIKNNGYLLSFNNVTMINVHNKIGYIIENKGQNNNNNSVYINKSYFQDISPLIHGRDISIYIDDSEFNNIKNLNSYPTISGLSYSKNYLNNCIIRNIKLLGTSLFDDQSLVNIKNSLIENISTYYKPIFLVTYNIIELNN